VINIITSQVSKSSQVRQKVVEDIKKLLIDSYPKDWTSEGIFKELKIEMDIQSLRRILREDVIDKINFFKENNMICHKRRIELVERLKNKDIEQSLKIQLEEIFINECYNNTTIFLNSPKDFMTIYLDIINSEITIKNPAHVIVGICDPIRRSDKVKLNPIQIKQIAEYKLFEVQILNLFNNINKDFCQSQIDIITEVLLVLEYKEIFDLLWKKLLTDNLSSFQIEYLQKQVIQLINNNKDKKMFLESCLTSKNLKEKTIANNIYQMIRDYKIPIY